MQLQVSSSPDNQMQRRRKDPPGQQVTPGQWASLVPGMAAPAPAHRAGSRPSPARRYERERGPGARAGAGLPGGRRGRRAPASFPAAARPASTARPGSLWDFSIKSSGSNLLQRCLAILLSSSVAMGRRVMSLTHTQKKPH